VLCLSFPLISGYPALWCGLTNTRTQSVGMQSKFVCEKDYDRKILDWKGKEISSLISLVGNCLNSAATSFVISCTLPVYTLLFRFMKYRFKKIDIRSIGSGLTSHYIYTIHIHIWYSSVARVGAGGGGAANGLCPAWEFWAGVHWRVFLISVGAGWPYLRSLDWLRQPSK